jgi:hypothetical protein
MIACKKMYKVKTPETDE